jgi:peptidoglycan hydrolase-like protein with peptidoglycan-binding domain
MSSATATTKPALNSTQREWLKKMGAALSVKVSDAPAESPADDAEGPTAPAPEAESPPTEPSKPISVEGKPTLKKGSKGQDVKDLQTLLNKNGAKLEVDGDFGKLTDAAVKDFQKQNPPLAVDGVVGKQTWAALASKQQPPKPPDTKPRTAVFIVTDAATNNAVKGAVVKLADKLERTGDTGQVTISIPPGSYPFGVTADGFEQAIGTIEVTTNPETQQRVELKGGEKRTTVVLAVSPSGKTKKGDKLELTATVTLGDGKVKPTGTVRFDVVLNKTGGRQALKDLAPVKDGKAVHVDTLLPGGTHLLDATFKPDGKDIVGSQSSPIEHTVEQTVQQKNVETGTKLFGTSGTQFASVKGSNKMTVPQQKTIFDDLLKKSIEKDGAAKELSEAELKTLAEKAAETVNKLAEVNLGTKTNQMIEKSTTLKAKVVELQFDKWTIKKGTPGGGSSCDKSTKTIIIDPNKTEEETAASLAHEVGHGTFTPPPKPSLASSKDGEGYILKNVESDFTDEGNAQFVACEVVVQLKAGGVTAHAPADADKSFQAIYDKFVAKTLTKDQAVKEMAKKFLNLRVSIPPNEPYYEYYGNFYMKQWNDSKPADKKVTALPSKDKLFK